MFGCQSRRPPSRPAPPPSRSAVRCRGCRRRSCTPDDNRERVRRGVKLPAGDGLVRACAAVSAIDGAGGVVTSAADHRLLARGRVALAAENGGRGARYGVAIAAGQRRLIPRRPARRAAEDRLRPVPEQLADTAAAVPATLSQPPTMLANGSEIGGELELAARHRGADPRRLIAGPPAHRPEAVLSSPATSA